ncbi:MAG: bis-aminopropyl spermidine synthase family protein [Candidatus Bathyarchaeota archaeon]|nr:bis-aminopropyl spermidine synthase family protein [Candidatus Bathyarchaeota archaeon]
MRKIETQILRALSESEKSFWELLDENRDTVKEFMAAINNLFNNGLINVRENGKIYLTEEGLKRAGKGSLEFKSKVCCECEGKRVVFDGKFREVLENYIQIVRDRPMPDANFFQGYMREQDVIYRLALMHYYGDLDGKSFVLIGDDDLLSVALSLTGLPSRILVLDIDKRLGDYIERLNGKHGLNIEFQQYDVSNPLPKELIGAFDVFSSEPLETLSGLKAFLSRGVACLKNGGAGYIGLSTAEASLRKWKAVELMLLKMNCVITDIIRDFSKYGTSYETANYEMFTIKLEFPVTKNPGICWYKSSLFRFEAAGKPKPLIKPERHIAIKYIDWKDDVTNPFLYTSKTQL